MRRRSGATRLPLRFGERLNNFVYINEVTVRNPTSVWARCNKWSAPEKNAKKYIIVSPSLRLRFLHQLPEHRHERDLHLRRGLALLLRLLSLHLQLLHLDFVAARSLALLGLEALLLHLHLLLLQLHLLLLLLPHQLKAVLLGVGARLTRGFLRLGLLLHLLLDERKLLDRRRRSRSSARQHRWRRRVAGATRRSASTMERERILIRRRKWSAAQTGTNVAASR